MADTLCHNCGAVVHPNSKGYWQCAKCHLWNDMAHCPVCGHDTNQRLLEPLGLWPPGPSAHALGKVAESLQFYIQEAERLLRLVEVARHRRVTPEAAPITEGGSDG